MPTVIKPKYSTTPSAVPLIGDLVEGEVALNIVDGRLFVRDNATNIVEVGLSPAGNVDINGGTIDGTTIGGTTPAAGNFSTVDIDGGTIDGVTIATSTANLTSLTAATADINGGTIDGVVIATSSATLTSLTATTADINGGTIDGTAIGGSVAAAGSFTTLDASGDGTVTGDFTVDTTTLHVDSTNNRVGVGTITPARTLDTVTSDQIVGRFESTSAVQSVITFADANTAADGVRIGAIGENLVLQTSSLERVRISTAGIVTGLWSDNGTANSSAQFVALTQAQYDGLTPDANTVYFIKP